MPAGDIHTEEERRLLYVALTRAQDRLVITTIAGPAARRTPRSSSTSCAMARGPELLDLDGSAGA